MNLVAHQLLSGKNDELKIGNLLGEAVKGKNYKNYTQGIAAGIKLHRFIDSFTDEHAVVKRSTSYLHASHGKWAPIVVDVFYDYLLIKNWFQFSSEGFNDFVSDCYQLFDEHRIIFSESVNKMIDHMIEYNWFQSYSTIEGVSMVLKNIGQRRIFLNNLQDATKALYLQEKKLEKDFLEFFPELVEECENWLRNNKSKV